MQSGYCGGAATGAWGIEGRQEGVGGVQVEAEEHEGGLARRLGEPAGVVTQPAAQLGGEGTGVLGMWGLLGARGVHGCVLLGEERKHRERL